MAKKAKKAAKKAAKKTAKKAMKKAASASTRSATAKKAAPKKAAKKAIKKGTPKKTAKKVVKKVANASTRPANAKKSAPKKAANASTRSVTAKRPAPKPEPKRNSISPYINFNGNCEEAFNHYRSVFGGQFSGVNRFKEMPPQEGQPAMPEEVGNLIMHIALPISKETILMGSDALEGFGPPMVFGNNFAININASSDSEADRLYNGLAEGGQATMPMVRQFWGSYFGMLTDKFGINWMISSEPEMKK